MCYIERALFWQTPLLLQLHYSEVKLFRFFAMSLTSILKWSFLMKKQSRRRQVENLAQSTISAVLEVC
jgi:hypothetical protein